MATVTIKEIARLCGVSEGTVDRAINNRHGISPKTKERVMEAVRAMNYKPDRIAQSLAKGKSMSIGLVFFDLYNNFISDLIEVIENVAKENNYFINLVLSHGERGIEKKGLDYLVERRVDGIILFPVGYGEEYVQYIHNLGVPVVSVYNYISDRIPYVGLDARSAMKNAVEHIARYDYEKIVLVNSRISKKIEQNLNFYTLMERQKGYQEGIRCLGLNKNTDSVIIEGLDYEAIDRQLREAGTVKTAFLCICDMYALEILKYLEEKKMKVPEEVGLMGFDNVSTLRYVKPRMATVSYDVKEMARKSFMILMKMIDGESAGEMENLISYEILDGASL